MSGATAMPLRVVGRTAAPARSTRRARPVARPAITCRAATAGDADAIHALIVQHLDEGHLLPRDRTDVLGHAARFVVAVHGRRVVGCAELAPLSRSLAEVRSLVVDRHARGAGVGRRLVDELGRRAAHADYRRLCALTHAPGYFVRMGFSIVPHAWLPEKVAADCQACPGFRRCGQFAVVRPVEVEPQGGQVSPRRG